MGTQAPPDPISFSVAGQVHGGQAPVTGATVQLYDAGNTGNGSAAKAMLATPAMTDGNGNFAISSGYSCATPTDQVYIVATGGNPGLGAGKTNPALVMMAALGNCSLLAQTQTVNIDEVTTVAAAWALAPFISSYSSIGATATNATGITNAFLNAQLIVNNATGTTATLPSNLTTESGKIDALADAIASCVNSDGGSDCTPLFTAATPSGGSAPTNTFDAAVNIVKNPGNNVAGVFAAITPEAPFPTTLTQAPNDWTLSLTVKGGGVNQPKSLAVDAEGNVWVADFNGLLSAFDPQGTPLSAAGYGSSVLSEDYGLTIDPSGNIWVSVEEYPFHNPTKGSIVEFLGASSGGSMGTSTVFANTAIDFPFGLASDSSGDILIANNGNSSVTQYDPTPGTYTPFLDESDLPLPSAVASDGSSGIWVADASGGNVNITHIDSSGNMLTACCGDADGLALDAKGNLWVADYEDDNVNDDGSIEEVTLNAGAVQVVQTYLTGGGSVLGPSDVAVDAAQNVWVTNYHPADNETYDSLSELAGSTSATPGSPISPASGYGLDAQLSEPYALALDPSGNIWVSNSGSNDVVMFFGLGAPTKTPAPPTPTAP